MCVCVVLGRAPLLLLKEFFKRLWLPHRSVSWASVSLRFWECEQWRQANSCCIRFYLDEFLGHRDTRSWQKSSHASAPTNVQSTVPHVTVLDNKIHSWIASASDHRAPTTESTDTETLYGTNSLEKNSVIKRETFWESQRRKMGESAQNRQTNTVRPYARRIAFLPEPH